MNKKDWRYINNVTEQVLYNYCTNIMLYELMIFINLLFNQNTV